MENENENEKRNYNDCVNSIEYILNNRQNKKSVALFYNCLKDLELNHNSTLSTKFLNGLIVSDKSLKKAKIINRILKRLDDKINFSSQNYYYTEYDNKGNTIKAKKKLKFLSIK